MDKSNNEVSIDAEYINMVVGKENLKTYLHLVDISDAILLYVIPWVATIAAVADMMVALLCAIIYLKTMKKNYKPVFVFIGLLALIGVILGWYVGSLNYIVIHRFSIFSCFLFENPHHHHHIELTVGINLPIYLSKLIFYYRSQPAK